jgi:hypothetical protein
MSSTPAALLRTLWRTVDLDLPPARVLDVVLPASVRVQTSSVVNDLAHSTAKGVRRGDQYRVC